MEEFSAKGIPKDVPINVPINEKVLALVREMSGINRRKMADVLQVDVKTIGRALRALPQIEHRGSKKAGGYYLKEF